VSTVISLNIAAAAAAVVAPILEHLQNAWNDGDGRRFSAAFADETDFVEIRGGHHRGVEAVARGHQAIFDTIYAGSTVQYQVDVARPVGADGLLAVVTSTLDAPTGPLAGTNHSRITATFRRQDDHWLITAFHNTLVAA
jgi:uncharacterized protein (TIGR02246 family)